MVLCEHTAGQQALIVGMGEYPHQRGQRRLSDVQDPALPVDDDGAARDVLGQRRPGGRVDGPVQRGKEVGQGVTLAGVPAEVRLDGPADRGGAG
ncbi:hypothetical protein [Streptomyces sp. MN13]